MPLAASLGVSHEVAAVLSLVVAIVLAIAVDRLLLHRGHAFATAMVREELTPMLDTRLRFLRRLVTLTILVVGLMIALSQVDGLGNLAAGVLASGALFAAVVGFAARQTLANLIAGVMLTIAQPLRIGDSVTVEGESGTVEDVRLNYTVVRDGSGRRLFVPNERLAAGILRNDTIIEGKVALEIALWLPCTVDADRALAVLAELADHPIVRIAEIGADGVGYSLTRGAFPPGEIPARASTLRIDALRALRGAGLLDAPSAV